MKKTLMTVAIIVAILVVITLMFALMIANAYVPVPAHPIVGKWVIEEDEECSLEFTKDHTVKWNSSNPPNFRYKWEEISDGEVELSRPYYGTFIVSHYFSYDINSKTATLSRFRDDKNPYTLTKVTAKNR